MGDQGWDLSVIILETKIVQWSSAFLFLSLSEVGEISPNVGNLRDLGWFLCLWAKKSKKDAKMKIADEMLTV
jgi:hypothetical protein